MKIMTIFLASMLLSGCSVSYSHKKVETAKVHEDIGTFSKKVHFIELMELLRDNWHQAPTPELKNKVNNLMLHAGLEQKCSNRTCWLAYQDLKITTQENFIVIEYTNKSVIKIDIDNPDRAAKVIYG